MTLTNDHESTHGKTGFMSLSDQVTQRQRNFRGYELFVPANGTPLPSTPFTVSHRLPDKLLYHKGICWQDVNYFVYL